MLKKLFFILTPRERKQSASLLVMVLIMALLDVLGVASILPFMAVLADPEIVTRNVILNMAFEVSSKGGVQTIEQFLVVLGLLSFVVLIASLAFKSATVYLQNRFIVMCEYNIATRLIATYLRQPYEWFLNRTSADLGKSILSEVSTVIHNGLLPIVTVIAQSLVVFALLGMLLMVDPLLTLGVIAILMLAYLGIYTFVSGWLGRLGEARTTANKQRFAAVSEAFGAIKEVKLGGLEALHTARFSKPAKVYADGQAIVQVIAQMPRFALEAVAFGGMLLISIYFLNSRNMLGGAIPMVALYAFAGYRLMPALQQIYSAATQMRYVGSAIDALYSDATGLKVFTDQGAATKPMALAQEISVNQATYRYPNAKRSAINSISLTIRANSIVGFAGATGSGKTTLIDILLGLLVPQQGTISVDGIPINSSNRTQWCCSVGYVPQNIYLCDDSVASNIAFGKERDEIDWEALVRAAKLADLHDFVVEELPQGYATNVGERGIRLSGGQRQRIAIARALYHNPRVLVMDEATSALDGLTERAVMNAISNISGEMTVILVAHRLNTLRQCNEIHLIENGELVESGTFDQLVITSRRFSAMTENG